MADPRGPALAVLLLLAVSSRAEAPIEAVDPGFLAYLGTFETTDADWEALVAAEDERLEAEAASEAEDEKESENADRDARS